MYMSKDLIDNKLDQLIDQFNKGKVIHKGFCSKLFERNTYIL